VTAPGHRILRAWALLTAPLLLLALQPAMAMPVEAATAWWQLAGFSGQSVSRVALVQGRLTVMVGGRPMVETASGFVPGAATPPPPPPSVTAGTSTWSIDAAGQVLVRQGRGPAHVDPGSPDLGAGAHLIAAPLATPGVVLAASTGGTIWRRSSGGGWEVSLLLLPTTLVTGTPAVTSLAAFNTVIHPESAVVYVGTDGYGTLLTDDGGDDWLSAAPGLPSDVLSLAADPLGAAPAIYAGTSAGLYIHRLQALPTIPNYAGPSLTGKWLVTLALMLAVILLAGLGLVAWSRRRPLGSGDKSPT